MPRTTEVPSQILSLVAKTPKGLTIDELEAKLSNKVTPRVVAGFEIGAARQRQAGP